MKYFVYKNLAELEAEARRLGTRHVQFEGDTEKVREALARPVDVGGFRVGNSIAIHPMEGCDGDLDGNPGELTFRRYDRYARGGAKLIWFEATAVRQDGRANPRQLALHPGTASEIGRMLEQTRKLHREACGSPDDLLEVLQLTHSGRHSVPQKLPVSHNPYVDAKTGVPADAPLLTDDDLERLEDAYVEAARQALAIGFRAVDVKATHGYLIAELLGAKTRPGRYGGPLENRLRFIQNVLGKIRATFGERLILCVRLGCYDGVPYYAGEHNTGEPCQYERPYPYGFGVDANEPLREDLTEVKQTIESLRKSEVRLINVSTGSPYFNPHVGRPFEKPDDGNYDPPEHPLLGVDRHFRIAGELQRTFPDVAMVGTGYSWLQKYAINAGAKNVADGSIRFFGLGRGSLAYPDFARDALAHGDLDERRVCKTLTYCTFLMRQKNHPLGQFPTGCPPFDKEGYGPIIKQAMHARKAEKKP